MSDIRIDAKILNTFTQKAFEKAGLSPEDAATEAEVLIWANLRGVDSHGVQRIPGYLDMIEKGWMNPSPNVRIIKESPAVFFMDADRGMGPIPTVQAMNLAIEKARNVGIGWGLIRNVTHQGAMGYYSEMAVAQGMAGIAIVCSPPNMAPFGAKAAGVHNSPIAFSFPTEKHKPVTLDMATSVAAGGKLSVASDKRVQIPVEWALAADGSQTTDPDVASILLPAGGPKGSGLALVFQCLTSLMAGNPLITPVLTSGVKVHNQNSLVAAIDINFFTDLDGYKTELDDTIDALKTLPTADGHDEILVPGEIEHRVEEERSENGIPLPPGTVEKLQEAARRLDLTSPV
jgi:LDH2 family malate/lactate/ureidoglycolate dehydrogenase